MAGHERSYTESETDTFYEVTLDNCDGSRVDILVWKSGHITMPPGTRPKVKRLLEYFTDAEAPSWVRENLEAEFK
jgi:hypothetical protein